MSSPLAGQRVLVVDDERAVAAKIVQRLERVGAVCVGAHSGTEAVDRLSAEAFDLLVTDVQMPGPTGLELLDYALALPEPPAVIVMTEHNEVGALVEALRRGADGYLIKPFDLDLATHEVSRLIELRAAQRALQSAGVERAAGPALVVIGELVNAFERADTFRAGHSARTARLAGAFAGPLGLDGARLTLAARVHDVGMVAIPPAQLLNQGPLERTTQHLVRVHPTLGARWIERVGADRAMVAAVAAHHERFDGAGYPGGLARDDIPPLARALGIAAAISAMCAPRPQRARRDSASVVEELNQAREAQFGSAEVDAAIEAVRRSPALLA